MGGTGAPAMTIASSMQTLEHPAPRPRHRDGPTVSWYGRLLIVSTLLLAAGWEILRLLLTIVTLD
ncbi:MAG: hypothetical protein C207_04480 [Bradyrhizobium sp. DFCI-1]|nr:MAG: hypothetical protein C207_04480 [Bradyrhizobium sp. DFCI-1]